MLKKKSGITLIVLVITIIVLLILTGVTLNVIVGNEGILNKTIYAKEKTIKAEMKEKLELAISELQMEKLGRATQDDITQEWLNEHLQEYEARIQESATKVIRMKKENIVQNFQIDELLNIEIWDDGNISYFYEILGRQGEKVEIQIYIQDEKNGLDKIQIADTEEKIEENNTEEKSFQYFVEVGKEYQIKITSKSGEERVETICIENYYYAVTKNFSEGVMIDNLAKSVEYNKPYQATISTKEDYELVLLTVKMGGETISVDRNTNLINIENVTGEIEIMAKTIYGISFDAVNTMDVHETAFSNDANLVKQYLFDGITNYTGNANYQGVLFDNTNSYIEISVLENVKIYAWSQLYQDVGGSSGKNIIVKKQDGEEYVDYQKCATGSSGEKYELMTLKPGKYRIFSEARYVNFSEWETEKVDMTNYYYSIRKKLGEGVSVDNPVTEVSHGSSYQTTLTVEDKYGLISLKVKMGGKEFVFNPAKRQINIEKVRDDIEIIAETIKEKYDTMRGIVIDAVYAMDIYDTSYSDDANLVMQYLFDGVTNHETGRYIGVLFDNTDSYIEMTVYKNVKIYAWSQLYQDGGGSSGKNIIVKKQDGEEYVDYQKCATDSSGEKYELMTLEPGKYRIFSEARYVSFSEWETEILE